MPEIKEVSESIAQPIPFMPSAPLAERPATILLVEDDPLVREVMFETLVWAGYRVLKAGNAAEARTVFRRCRRIVSLLLTDVVLPDENGKSLAQELRQNEPAPRVILISGYPEHVVCGHAPAEDGILYLPKTFSADSLVQTVALALMPEQKELAI